MRLQALHEFLRPLEYSLPVMTMEVRSPLLGGLGWSTSISLRLVSVSTTAAVTGWFELPAGTSCYLIENVITPNLLTSAQFA